MARILILDTHDTHLSGHGWSTAKNLKDMGHNVCFMSLHRHELTTENYFYDLCSKYGRLKYYLTYYLRDLIGKKIFMRPEKRYAFVSTYLWGKSADNILKRCPFVPEFIVFTWVPGFITPKIVRDLYNKTGAKIVFQMVDEAILSLCHYHKDCDKFKEGCKKCKHVSGLTFIPRHVMAQKVKYWNDMPAYIICTTHDKIFANQVSFLKHMKTWITVAIPDCAPVISKAEAREYFNIPKNDFVIFTGSNDVMNTEKGLPYVVDAINIMMKQLSLNSRDITLLVLGHNSDKVEIKVGSSVNIIKKGFLPKEDFLKAYYACDVHASATLYDSGPMMVNYALACGRPVVSFPVGVALDLVENGRTGYIAPFKDTNAFADGLIKLYHQTNRQLDTIGKDCIAKIESFRNRNFGENLSRL
jgi:glycosyltransferase involved in cell wall biosynthesis